VGIDEEQDMTPQSATTIIAKSVRIADSVKSRDQCEMAERYTLNAIRYISATRPIDIQPGFAIHMLQEIRNKLFIKWYTCLS